MDDFLSRLSLGLAKAAFARKDHAAALKETAQAFDKRYADSAWAKKASVWK